MVLVLFTITAWSTVSLSSNWRDRLDTSATILIITHKQNMKTIAAGITIMNHIPEFIFIAHVAPFNIQNIWRVWKQACMSRMLATIVTGNFK